MLDRKPQWKRGDVADPELEQDLLLLEALREGRMEFFDRVLKLSAVEDHEMLVTLRQEPVYQLAEFLFALNAYGIASVDAVASLAELHNRYLRSLLDDQDKRRRIGLQSGRIERAFFDGDKMAKLLENWGRDPRAIDQSDLARFLVGVMSTETCRKVVVACHGAGFLKRERSPYGAVLVYSLGVLEETFGQCLRKTRLSLG